MKKLTEQVRLHFSNLQVKLKKLPIVFSYVSQGISCLELLSTFRYKSNPIVAGYIKRNNLTALSSKPSVTTTNLKAGKITIAYDIYEQEGIKCPAQATIEEGKVTAIKLLFKAPKGHYYHYMNDACLTFEEKYPQYL